MAILLEGLALLLNCSPRCGGRPSRDGVSHDKMISMVLPTTDCTVPAPCGDGLSWNGYAGSNVRMSGKASGGSSRSPWESGALTGQWPPQLQAASIL